MPKFICSIKDANNRYGMADIIEASGTENAKAQFKKAYNTDFLQSALNLDLNAVIIVALQIIGGAIGNMICVNNTVAVCATVGTPGKEGKIIRINLLPTVIYTAVVILVAAVALFALKQ